MRREVPLDAVANLEMETSMCKGTELSNTYVLPL